MDKKNSESQSSLGNSKCLHTRKHAMWKSILFSLEMAAPKPSPVYRKPPNPVEVEAPVTSHDTNNQSTPLNNSVACYTNACFSPCTQENNFNSQKADTPLVQENISPQRQIHQNLNQSGFSSYIKFNSSIEETDEQISIPALFEVPEGFGNEFHGPLSKGDCERILLMDGDYIVRKSCTKRNAGHLILSLRFDGKLKHYQLFFENNCYSLGIDKEKFSSLHDLVAKGFVTLYMESRAGNFLLQQQLSVMQEVQNSSDSQKKSTSTDYSTSHSVNDRSDDFHKSIAKEFNSNMNKSMSESVKYGTQSSVESMEDDLDETQNLEISPHVKYSSTPYYEITRSLRKYNAKKFSESEVDGVLVGGEKKQPPLLSFQKQMSMDETHFREHSKERVKNEVEDTNGTTNKRSSRFWKFGASSRKETKAPDNLDDISGIAHNFKVQSFTFTWCSICTHFLMGVKRQGVRCTKCKLAAHSSCASVIPNDCTPQLAELNEMFGKDLSLLMSPEVSNSLAHPAYSCPASPSGDIALHLPLRDEEMVPSVVKICVTEIEARGLNTEGIYRVSGGVDIIQSVRIALEKGSGQDAVCESSVSDINAVAGVLKLFFRQLPVPLITEKCFNVLLKAYESQDEKLDLIKLALTTLPAAHYHTLLYLLLHFNRVVEHSSSNKMTANSLSVVFAPTLVEHNPNSLTSSLMMQSITRPKNKEENEEERKCPLASTEELDDIESENSDTENHNAKCQGDASKDVKECECKNLSNLASATSSIMGAVAGSKVTPPGDKASQPYGTQPDGSLQSDLPKGSSKIGDHVVTRSGPVSVSTPCSLSTSSMFTSLHAHPHLLTPDHLLCMKFAALEPKILELLIDESRYFV